MKLSRMLTASLLALSLVTVNPAVADEPESPAPIKVGMLLTLSGNYASAGEDCRKGIDAALAETKSHLEVVYADSKADPSTAIGEFRKLTESDKVLAVYSHRSNIGMALNPVSAQASVPLLGAAGNHLFAKNNKFAFQVWPKSDEEGEFVASEFVKRGYKRIALLSTDDEWTSSIGESFRKKIAALGGTIVFDQSFIPADTDFRTAITMLKSKAPDAVFLDMLLPQLGPVIKQASEQRLSGALFTNFYVAKKDVLDTAGSAALEGVHFVDIDTELPALRKALSPDGTISPPGLTVASYLGTLLLAQTASELKGAATKESFYSALLNQQEIRATDRKFAITDRCVKIPLTVRVMRDGKPSAVDKR